MPTLIRHSITNRLLQRVRRHQQMATLFGPVDVDVFRRVNRGATTAQGGNVVLGQRKTEEPTRLLLTSDTVPTVAWRPQPVEPVVERSEESSPISASLATSEVREYGAIAAEGVPTQRSTTALPGTAEQADAPPTPTQPTASSEDRSWSRLQAIFQAHEGRQTSSTPHSRQSTASTPIQRATSLPQKPAAQRPTEDLGRVALTPSVVDGQDNSSVTAQASAHTRVAVATQPGVQPILAQADKAMEQVVDATSQVGPSFIQRADALPHIRPAQPTSATVAVHDEPAPMPLGSGNVEVDKVDWAAFPSLRARQAEAASTESQRDQQAIPLIDVAASSKRQVESASERKRVVLSPATEPQQAISPAIHTAEAHSVVPPQEYPSLEQVWPVQRTAQSEPSLVEAPTGPDLPGQSRGVTEAEGITRQDANQRAGGDVATPAERQGEDTLVESILQHVQTARPTESAVHVMTPRRPRPQRVALPAMPAETEPTSAVPQAEFREEMIQARSVDDHAEMTSAIHAVERTEPDRPQQRISAGQESEDAAPAFPHIGGSSGPQAQPDARVRASSADLIVQTEIGSLPVDLWTFIDEPAPQASRQSAAMVAAAAVDASPGSPIPTPAAPAVETFHAHREEMTSSSAPFARAAPNATEAEANHALLPTVDTDDSSSFAAESETFTEPAANRQNRDALSTSIHSVQRVLDQGQEEPSIAVNPSGKAAPEVSPAPTLPELPGRLNGAPALTAPTSPTSKGAATDVLMASMLQRQLLEGMALPGIDGADEAALGASPSGPVGDADGDEQVEDDVDVSELAHQVYAYLQRRLAVERERMG